ncbi:MAG TPA: UvrD-helicase domain-containing protein [Bacillota bacterium]|nr:UvrD-helicase domain-containing protein [Bacillota bacterium]
MNTSERDFELARLHQVSQEIRLQQEEGQKSLPGAKEDFHGVMEDYWENIKKDFWDEAQHVERVNRERSLYAANRRRLKRLDKMVESPYFGRIDFQEAEPRNETSPEMIYIGIAALEDSNTGDSLIYDWRSPVAGMFYDYEPGPAEYICPIGKVTGKMTLKRQYRIIDSRMQSFFDTDLKIDDEILQEILGKSADGTMRTIVNSIQREQNRVIRDENHRLLMVQGPAGSGKTSIALHRVAYLLYQERETISAQNILILSPNRIFSDYIAGVLPELGEANAPQTTFHDYLYSQLHLPMAFEDRETQLEYLLSNPEISGYRERAAAIRYKSSPEFTEVLRNYLGFIEEKLLRDIPVVQFRGRTILSQEEWTALYRENLAYLPPAERLAQIKRRVQVKLRPLIHDLRREKAEAIAATGEEVNEKTIRAMARIGAIQELESLEAELDRRTSLDPFNLYRRLFLDEKLLPRLAGATGIPEDWPEIRSQTLAWFGEGRIPYEDLLPLLYFQGNLRGFPTHNEIRHLIIDEAQDYIALQYEVLKKLFPRSAWTVLGDPDQTVHPYLRTADFLDIAQATDFDNPIVIRLNRSYRSTLEIRAFCRALLQESEPTRTHVREESVNRSGPAPRVISVKTEDSQRIWIHRLIREFQNEQSRSIGIVCKTAGEAQRVYENLADSKNLTLITRETEVMPRGTVIIPVYLAKGLEFDAVIIPDAGAGKYSRDTDRQLLYIACTRALHRLVLFYRDDVSPLIAGMGPGLYSKEDQL